jgi:tetratricopeptide (TPR) repeat protein
VSRFESKLIAELSGEFPATMKAITALRLAAYRARKGRLSEARELIRRVREEFSVTYDLRVFANINYAEAICEFFGGHFSAAVQKIRRSRVLCQGCTSDDDLPAIVAAWSASFSRIEQNWGEVESSIRDMLSGMVYVSSEADCRMSLVLGDCYQEVEDYTSADRYYSRARSRALSCGDDSMLGAVLYNRAAIRVFNLRLNRVLGNVSDIAGCGISVEATSAENYSQYTYDSAMPGIYDLLSAQLHLLRGEFASALERLNGSQIEELLKDWPAVEIVRQADLLRAQRALDAVSHEAARSRARELIVKFPVDSFFGDVVISAFTLSEIFVGTDELLRQELMQIANVAFNRHKRVRAGELDMLTKIEALIHPK